MNPTLVLIEEQEYIKLMLYTCHNKNPNPFFTWFEDFTKTYNLNKYKRSLNMLETQFQSYTTKDGNVIQSIHPPEVVLDIKGAIAAPYKLEHKGTDSVSNHKDIGQLIQQNNYTNLYLHSIGKQTTRIEGLLNKDKIQHI